MKTKITELLQIEYPIFQGGMAWVAEHKLAEAAPMMPKPPAFDTAAASLCSA